MLLFTINSRINALSWRYNSRERNNKYSDLSIGLRVGRGREG
jgi:hypothetical protein